MAKREFGRAEYRAYRTGNRVKLVATGTMPNFNMKVDFEQLPFLIHPPMQGFYFISPDIVLPALRPFMHEDEIDFPSGSPVVTIVDADGEHQVDIQPIPTANIEPVFPSDNDDGFCVFSMLATEKMMIAPCGAPIVGVFTKVFGPETYRRCMEYVANGS
jgi:hypothetical protein